MTLGIIDNFTSLYDLFLSLHQILLLPYGFALYTYLVEIGLRNFYYRSNVGLPDDFAAQLPIQSRVTPEVGRVICHVYIYILVLLLT